MRTRSRLPLVNDRKETDDLDMLSAHCPRHGHTVLIPTARIDRISNGERHMTVHWHCTCGEHGATRFPRRRPAPTA